eukprot:CAMPEP_0175739498 /NCGR_PEP_ID=MMETSP0097-20121207/55033_1 /TAXON_ID=311494 /ORGANISM="Alexandrium monilatum, Strain CCMP3105" /LENGTH=350 /DNA_ID=CAMNT_0017047759 /DNA_START=165 /DNA_END=1214 /DNA_ORIENTATION=-
MKCRPRLPQQWRSPSELSPRAAFAGLPMARARHLALVRVTQGKSPMASGSSCGSCSSFSHCFSASTITSSPSLARNAAFSRKSGLICSRASARAVRNRVFSSQSSRIRASGGGFASCRGSRGESAALPPARGSSLGVKDTRGDVKLAENSTSMGHAKLVTLRGEVGCGVRAKCSSVLSRRGGTCCSSGGSDGTLGTVSGFAEAMLISMTEGDRWEDKLPTEIRVTCTGSPLQFQRACETSHRLPSSAGRERQRLSILASHLTPEQSPSRPRQSFTNLYSTFNSPPCSGANWNHTGTREIQRGYVTGHVRNARASSSPSSVSGLHSPSSVLDPTTWRASPGRVATCSNSKT